MKTILSLLCIQLCWPCCLIKLLWYYILLIGIEFSSIQADTNFMSEFLSERTFFGFVVFSSFSSFNCNLRKPTVSLAPQTQSVAEVCHLLHVQ